MHAFCISCNMWRHDVVVQPCYLTADGLELERFEKDCEYNFYRSAKGLISMWQKQTVVVTGYALISRILKRMPMHERGPPKNVILQCVQFSQLTRLHWEATGGTHK